MLKPLLITIICICLFILGACKKDVIPPPASPTNAVQAIDSTIQPPPLVLPDSIFYSDITDDTIKSVFGYHPAGMCNAPYPADTSVSRVFDLDGDQTDDLEITTSTSYTFTSASNPCANYYYNISLGMPQYLQGDSMIIRQPGICDSLSFGSVIGPGRIFGLGGASVRVSAYMFGFSFPQYRDLYVGFKMTRNGVIMHGWLLIQLGSDNSIVFKSYALNRRHNNDITAGQTN
jgi:hypothetical protein